MPSLQRPDSTHHINRHSQSSGGMGETWQSTGAKSLCTTFRSLPRGFQTTLVRHNPIGTYLLHTADKIQLSEILIVLLPTAPLSRAWKLKLTMRTFALKKMQTENISPMDVKEEAMRDFLEHRNEAMKLYVWSGKCRSWEVTMQAIRLKESA